MELASAAASRAVEAVLLDMDGTIVEFGIDYDLGRRRAIRRIRTEVPGAGGLQLEARSAREVVARVRASLGDGAAEEARRIVFEEYESVELEAARRVNLREGVLEALKGIRSCGYRVALVTNNSRRATEVILRRFPELTGYLDAIVTRDDSGDLKPGIAGLAMALRALGVDGVRSLMAGDTPADVRAGKRAGALSVGISGGAAPAEELYRAGADFVVGSVVELGDALRMARDLRRRTREPFYAGARI